MKPTVTQQELLLVTTCSLFKKQWCDRNEEQTNQHYSPVEELEEACWNGLLPEILPEITKTSISESHLSLWRISQGNRFLHIELSTAPAKFEAIFSIEPDVCLALIYCN